LVISGWPAAARKLEREIVFWRWNGRPHIDGYAEGQRLGGHVAPSPEDHERRRREGVTKVCGERPEEAENTRGERASAGLIPCRLQRIAAWSKTLKAMD
jgi:hypothetical protein